LAKFALLNNCIIRFMSESEELIPKEESPVKRRGRPEKKSEPFF
jgi:hypothetical protein